MATLTRTRTTHDDVADTTRDLRLGIPTPFPSNALVREEDELLDSLADEELNLDSELHPRHLPPQHEHGDSEAASRDRDVFESVHKPLVSLQSARS